MGRTTVRSRDARRMSAALVIAMFVAGAAALRGQDPMAIQHAFEAGHYQQVVDAAGPEAAPDIQFLAALSAQKLGATDSATAFLGRLVQLPSTDAWHFVGLSATQLLAGDDASALASAQSGTAANPELPEASYELGLVLMKRQDWAGAAEAFDRASMLDPSFAHAFYYAGLARYRSGRPDLMAVRFERFLKLAPEAPERPEVQQIMRTVRGR